MNPKKSLRNTTFLVQLVCTLPVTPFKSKGSISIPIQVVNTVSFLVGNPV